MICSIYQNILYWNTVFLLGLTHQLGSLCISYKACWSLLDGCHVSMTTMTDIGARWLDVVALGLVVWRVLVAPRGSPGRRREHTTQVEVNCQRDTAYYASIKHIYHC